MMFKRDAFRLALLASSICYAAPVNKNAGAGKAPAVENAGPAPAAPVAGAPLTPTAAAFQEAFTGYVIEDDVPLPTKRVGVKGESAYPYKKMEINQSFFVPVSEKMKEPWKTLTSLSSRMSRDMWPKRFVTERQKKGDVEGVRVWRQADGVGENPPEKRKSPKKADTAAAPATGDAPSGEAQTGAEAPKAPETATS
jgi:hypothetical protein